jgi:hypothetical protein
MLKQNINPKMKSNINSKRNNYTAPFVNIGFHIPGSKGYKFYESGKYIRDYCENAKTHKPREGASECRYTYSKYMQDEKGHDNIKINTCQSSNSTNGKIFKNSIVFDSIVSICEDDTQNLGLLDYQKDTTEYFFNEFIKSHKFQKENWAYFSALHTNTDNDHLHVVFYQPNNVDENKIVKSNFIEASKYKKFPKNSAEFKNYVVERQKVITKKSCIEHVKFHLGCKMDEVLCNGCVKESLALLNEIRRDYKIEIKINNSNKVLIDLNNDINHLKREEGRMQYANIVK